MVKKTIILMLLFSALVINVDQSIFAQNDSDIIDITGTNFGLLNLYFEVNQSREVSFAKALKLKNIFDKYLRWSGIFKIQKSQLTADLILKIGYGQIIYASVQSDQGEQLYYASSTMITESNREEEITKIVEDIIFKLTGRRSIFRSAIAYIEKNREGNHKLLLIDTFGSNKTVLVDDGEINVLPRWKKDAKGIMYTSLRKYGGKLMYYDFSSKQSRLLMEHESNLSGGTWNKTADKLVVSIANNGNTDLFLINSGVDDKQLTFRSSIESNPSLSPDGARLLFVSNRSGSIQIYQKNFSSGETFRMTFEGSYNVEPRWSNDGNYIVYAGIKSGRFQIFFMDKDGLWVKQISKGRNSSEQPVWSPDGRQILYLSKVENVQKLFIMRVDGTFNRRVTKSGQHIHEINPAWIYEHKWK